MNQSAASDLTSLERLARIAGGGLVVLPFLLVFPVHYWTFHFAGGWLVSTRLNAQDRSTWLAFSYLLLMVSLFSINCFIGLLLLYYGRYRRHLVVWLLIPSGLLFPPGVFIACEIIASYFQFS